MAGLTYLQIHNSTFKPDDKIYHTKGPSQGSAIDIDVALEGDARILQQPCNSDLLHLFPTAGFW